MKNITWPLPVALRRWRQIRRTAAHFALGPVLLALAGLIDLYLITRVFLAQEPLVGALSFFIFGAATGVPCQWILARGTDHHVHVSSAPRCGRSYFLAAMGTGILAAIGTAAWLFALGSADPAVVFPLAHLVPVLLALYEWARGLLRPARVIKPLLLLMVGVWLIRSPDLAAFAGLTPAILLALAVKNLAGATSEAAERHALRGSIARFNALRFLFLAGVGVPLAIAALGGLGKLGESWQLIQRCWPIALPLHAVTMVLTFAGGYLRTRAKAEISLTSCGAAYAMPLFLTPLAAVVLNFTYGDLFPTVSGSLGLVAGGLLILAAVVWLANSRLLVVQQTFRTDPLNRRTAGGTA